VGRRRSASIAGAAAATGSMGLRAAVVAAICWLALASGGARAALFEDEEARKAILDLRSRVTAAEEQARTRAAANEDQLQSMRRSLLEMNSQIENLRAEVARLRGANEQLQRDVSELQRKQQDIGQTVDERLRKFEPQKVTVDGIEFNASPEETRQFDEALALMRAGEFDKASQALSAFMRRWPASGYTPAARFWQGNALYGKRDYKEAIGVFRAFLIASPTHPRAPEALLAIANSQSEMKDSKAARKTLEELIKTYPESEAAVAGKERLASLK
jgi:tol-pal system protein YbgF